MNDFNNSMSIQKYDKRTSLINRIEKAWSDTPMPNTLEITGADKFDSDTEPGAIQRSFANRKWQDITLEFIEGEYLVIKGAAIFFLTAKAYFYFLPAFILMVLKDPREADTLLSAITTSLRQKEKLGFDN